MSARRCPKCREIGFTWVVDEEESALTQWHCSLCGYSAKEDESEESPCTECHSGMAIRLRDQSESYRYCTACESHSPG